MGSSGVKVWLLRLWRVGRQQRRCPRHPEYVDVLLFTRTSN
ncbi:MAG: hypothetical protein ABUL47_05725 [Leifsonia sp.]